MVAPEFPVSSDHAQKSRNRKPFVVELKCKTAENLPQFPTATATHLQAEHLPTREDDPR
jgi:hypothetical protein